MSNAILSGAAKAVRDMDKISAKYGASKIETLTRRASALDMLPETRAAVYPLAWLIETGRLSSKQEDALLAVPARIFAAKGLEIATRGACVNDSADAWKALAV